MICNVALDTAEHYVAGTLSTEEQAAFEEHFFACDTCLASVQALQAARAVLDARSDAMERPAFQPMWRGRRFAWLAVAASLVATVLVWRVSRPQPIDIPPAVPASTPAPAPAPMVTERETQLARRSAVIPPPYVALTTRAEGDSDERRFEDAMVHYVAGRYTEAARGLDALARRAPGAAHVQFFLGVSQLMAGNTDEARDALTRTVRAKAAPYSDEAYFYLAKTELRARNVIAARAALEAAIKRDAGPSGEAKRLRDDLESLQ